MRVAAVLWSEIRDISTQLGQSPNGQLTVLEARKALLMKALFQPTEEALRIIWNEASSWLGAFGSSQTYEEPVRQKLTELYYWQTILDRILNNRSSANSMADYNSSGHYADLAEFEKRLGICFLDKSLLRNVFVTKEYLRDTHEEPLASNERLEFLGDSVIRLATVAYVYNRYSEPPVCHELGSIRSVIETTSFTGQVGRSLNLGEYLLVGRNQEFTGELEKEYSLCCTLEALAGALFLDQGFEVACAFVNRIFGPQIQELVETEGYLDNENILHRLTRKHLGVGPRINFSNVSLTSRDVITEIYVSGELWAREIGSNKVRSRLLAAKVALQKFYFLYPEAEKQK